MAARFTTWGRRNRKERQIALLSARIPDTLTLDRTLLEAAPDLRQAVFERMRPFLRFQVDPARLRAFPTDGEAADRSTVPIDLYGNEIFTNSPETSIA